MLLFDTCQVDGESNEGAAFVFNPSARELNTTLLLDESLGFKCYPGVSSPLQVSLLGSSDHGESPHLHSLVECGATLDLRVPPSTALALGFSPLGCVSAAPQVYGAALRSARVNATEPNRTRLALDGVRGEAGAR